MRSETIQKMNPFKRIVSFKIDEVRSELLSFALNRKTRAESPQFGKFNSIALVQAGGTEYSTKWIESDQKEIIWESEYIKLGIKSLPLQKIEASGFVWSKFQESSNKPIYFSVFEIQASRKSLNKKAYILGMSLKNPLSGVADDYRGSSGKLYIVNDKALVAAHTNKNYDGASFAADPIYQDLKTNKRAMSSGFFVDLDGDSAFSYYEKIEHSNLFAVITSPKTSMKAFSTLHLREGVPTIFGMLAFFAFIAFFFTQKISIATGNPLPFVAVKSDEGSIDSESIRASQQDDSLEGEFENLELKRQQARNLRSELMKKGLASLNPFARLDSAPEKALSNAPITKSENNEKTLELLKMISQGLNKIFAERISGVIAESSLILVKSNDLEIKGHAKAIQEVSRKSRELLRELDQFNITQPMNFAFISLAEVCEHALAKFQNEFEIEGIEVQKNFDASAMVQASLARLQLAIEKVIMNSIEALKGREEKILTLNVRSINERAELCISDTGIGMPKEIQAKVFLPFYREFSHTDGNGLGLSFVQGVIEGMRGQIKLQSSPGAGTEMTMLFECPKLEQSPIKNAKSNQNNYEVLRNPKLNLDFVEDQSEDRQIAKSYFELDEKDLDQDFDEHLKKLSDRLIQRKTDVEDTKPEVLTAEFNLLKDFESDDEDVDDFKVTIRSPSMKTTI